MKRVPGVPIVALLLLGLLPGLLASGCRGEREPTRRQESLLGTICVLSIYERVPEDVFTGAFDVIRGIEARMSVQRADSEVSAVNRAAGIEPVRVSDDTFEVIERGLELGERSGGAFDITVGPLVALWGIGTDSPRIPAPEEISGALELLGLSDVVLSSSERTVYLKRKGMAIDLGAIAKGYAGDRVAQYLKSRGVLRAIVDLGGNIVVLGTPEGRPAWRVGVQSPREARGVFLGILQVTDTSVVTSGDYERYFEHDGVRYHHILDTTTGSPVRNGVVSTTVVCASSTMADALSTSLFALGPERGLALARSIPGVEAMVIDSEGRILLTPGLRPLLAVTDDSFRVESADP